jgi:dTDP-4-dehydrorhamnose reductase
MKAILFGAGGMLGRDIQSQKPSGHELHALTHRELDVRNSDAMAEAITSVRPQWVINASGYTNVDGAAREPEMADAVNAVAVGEMARLCRKHDCVLLHYSTDYVFDGTKTGFYSEDDAPNPLSTYGRSKLNGEALLRASGTRHLVIRSQWLFGHKGSSFVSTIFEKAQNRVPTRAADDQHGCVTYSVDLARVSWAMIDFGLLGTYNVANRGRVSRYDLARKIFGAFDAGAYIAPCRASEFPTAPGARRPDNTPLDVRKAEQALGSCMPEWTDAIDRYLQASGVGARH